MQLHVHCCIYAYSVIMGLLYVYGISTVKHVSNDLNVDMHLLSITG